jgi:hypothetical protein
MRAETLPLLLCLSVSGFNSLSAQQAATAPVTLSVTDQSGAGIPFLQIRVVPASDPIRARCNLSSAKTTIEIKAGLGKVA